eukprot:gnl/TRDRNA2_/TRDRNA2_180430_c0_seq1.p1 gnl/TRDRNA2_/TRDRNA2_180430_c0~~gnl/TRDRNA2_/TRDRNA2_180430_c0_seq1.p1  ORF type:complete len:479 (-),score=146.27 gnl/TRDRNA2_/TRDRNA2_180430_c0_seq1:75-1511(-)
MSGFFFVALLLGATVHAELSACSNGHECLDDEMALLQTGFLQQKNSTVDEAPVPPASEEEEEFPEPVGDEAQAQQHVNVAHVIEDTVKTASDSAYSMLQDAGLLETNWADVQEQLMNAVSQVSEVYEKGEDTKKNFWKKHGDEVMYIAKAVNKKLYQGLHDGSVEDVVDSADQAIGSSLAELAKDPNLDEDKSKLAEFFQKDLHELANIFKTSIKRYSETADAKEPQMLLQLAADENADHSAAMKAKIMQSVEAVDALRAEVNRAAEVAGHLAKEFQNPQKLGINFEEVAQGLQGTMTQMQDDGSLQKLLSDSVAFTQKYKEKGAQFSELFLKNHGDEIMFLAKRMNKRIYNGLQDGTFDEFLGKADEELGKNFHQAAENAKAESRNAKTVEEKEESEQLSNVASFLEQNTHELAKILRSAAPQDGEAMLQLTADTDKNSAAVRQKIRQDIMALKKAKKDLDAISQGNFAEIFKKYQA